MKFPILILISGLFLLPASAIAQDAALPGAGDVLRVHRQSGQDSPIQVTLLSLRADSMTAFRAKTRDTVRIALRDVHRLEVRTGTKSKWLLGGGLGAAAGFLGGAIIGGSSGDADEDVKLGQGLLGGVLGLGAGGMIGAIIGSQIKTDRWSDVPLEQVRLRLIAGGRGAGVMLSLRF